MGRVKDLNSIPNLLTILTKEGFAEVKLSYLDGLWVMIELKNEKTKRRLLQHTGANSWFHDLQAATLDFVSDERVVWVDIEGIPLSFWSHATFSKIGKKWGEVMDIEESPGSSFARKRLCIKTCMADNILETFKVSFKGKVYLARAKELFTWTPCFTEYKDSGYISEDESILGTKNNPDDSQQGEDALVGESDEEGVSDTLFGDNPSSPCNNGCVDSAKVNVQHTADPFGFYDLLKKPPKNIEIESDPSLSHPPGLTPEGSQQENQHNVSIQRRENCNDSLLEKESSPTVNSKVNFNSQDSHVNESSSGFSTRIHSRTTLNRGSILEVLDDMIKVGQSMGYVMEGCSKDIECIISLQGAESNVLKRTLWEYISGLINRWKGETIVLGDFNEVSFEEERFDSIFNQSCARAFNHFISSSGLLEVKMEGYSFTWSHPSATKTSKLDRFFVSEGIFSTFLAITAVCLDRYLSDHQPIILNEIHTDFGPTPFRIYHSWFKRDGFDAMVEQAWRSFTHTDSNRLIRFKKKLQDMKKIIRVWIREKIISHVGVKNAIIDDLVDIGKNLDTGVVSDEMLANQGDENSKNFHGIINKRRSQLAIRGVFVSGDWHTEPTKVKDTFYDHFASRFKQPICSRLKLSMSFPNRLSPDQIGELDMNITMDEIRAAVWDCGENKSPRPDGYTFEFFRRYWNLLGSDFCSAVECFFVKGSFPRSCNSSFIALIPKVTDAKFVTDFRPISLISSVYKVVTKILANHLAMVISDLVSNTQSTFVANRQILDGPFILNEDFLLDVLQAFGFGPRWCMWIRGIFSSNMASILVNGSPTAEFLFFCGLKQGDHLAPLLFILVTESLHISVSRAVNDGVFKGLQIQGSTPLSHLFYADDVVFIGEWSDDNLENLIRILNCFYLASVMQTPFKYLGVMVGDHMSRYSAWSNTTQKVHARLSKWKVKTISVGGRLTLLKSVLGAVLVYNMLIYKAPKGVLHEMAMIRNKFFNGADSLENKITWVAWDKVLASKKNGGLGVSSFYALNRALLLKWVWCFLSQDGSLWSQVISAIHGSCLDSHSSKIYSTWGYILREVQVLASKGFDFLSHCKIRVGDGSNTKFWLDTLILDMPLCVRFPRIFALETVKEVSVAAKWGASSLDDSFRRQVRDGAESQQWSDMLSMLGTTTLSSSSDRWVCDLIGDGVFRVKEIRSTLDDLFLPSSGDATRWVKYVPIKVNGFAWRARIDRLQTRGNLVTRGVTLDSSLCPVCGLTLEDSQHLFFRCDLAKYISQRIFRWWKPQWVDVSSFVDWYSWFASIRLSVKLKTMLEDLEIHGLGLVIVVIEKKLVVVLIGVVETVPASSTRIG
uniref:RNA-directed DNA polymerase, eukaryota n=1 Tax=Tanacetum cinerariifolium TaxID=118510 RepID=A0A699IHL5_TANCI|nr:RNA-directed DNA polymerase, eukaryota [Tanacetum cinerariifolium]